MVRFKSTVLTLLAAIILTFSFAPIGLWLCTPVAYALYLKVLSKDKDLLFNSFLFGFTSNLIILSWSKTFVGVAPWILLSILQGLYLLPVGLVAKYLRNPIAWLSAIIVMDEAKSYFPFGGFGWTRIAFSQVGSPFLEYVSIFGVIGLSLITLAISLAFFKPRFPIFATLVIGLFASSSLISEVPAGESVKIRAIQGGVPERGLSFNSRAQAVLDNHIAVTNRDFQEDDALIIWPENAIDVDPLQNELVNSKIRDLQLRTQVPLLAGAILSDQYLYNSAILFNKDGVEQSIYIKRYLTPFGEYIPLRSIASLVSPHVDRVTDFSPGRYLTTHLLESTKISSVICYEILSDRIFRESASNSGIVAVLTNSATFSGSAEGNQQMAITRIRAVETGRNIVSVSTTGPSAFIDYRGEVVQELKDGEVGSIARDVGIRNGQTLANRFGGYFSTLVILLALATLSFFIVRRRGKS